MSLLPNYERLLPRSRPRRMQAHVNITAPSFCDALRILSTVALQDTRSGRRFDFWRGSPDNSATAVAPAGVSGPQGDMQTALKLMLEQSQATELPHARLNVSSNPQ